MFLGAVPSQYTVSRQHRPASETPLEWRFADRPVVAHFQCLNLRWYVV